MGRAILLCCAAAWLCLAATPPAVAQETDGTELIEADKRVPRLSPAQLRAAYRAAEKRLADAAQTAHAKWRESEGDPTMRAPLREAVAQLFDARQQLQASELEELRARVERLDMLLGDRANRRDLLIDARTDELLEQGPLSGPQDVQKVSQTPQAAKYTTELEMEDAKGLRMRVPIVVDRRLLKLELADAEAAFSLQQKKYDRVKALFDAKAVEQGLVDEQEAKLRSARLRLDRVRVQVDALRHSGDMQDDQVDEDPEIQRQVLEVEVEGAKAALAGAENALEYATRMHKNGLFTELELRAREALVPRAKVELKKAQAKLESFLRKHPDQAGASEAKTGGDGAEPPEQGSP